MVSLLVGPAVGRDSFYGRLGQRLRRGANEDQIGGVKTFFSIFKILLI